MASSLYILAFPFAFAIGIISYLLTTAKQPSTNRLYGTTSSLLLTYSIGGSILMYGMMLYYFSAFYEYAPIFLILFNTFLLLLSSWSLFANPLRVEARKNGDSGLRASDPPFISIVLSSLVILGTILFVLLRYRNTTQHLSILVLMNLLLIPFFFFTSGAINSYALNNFTYNF